jgi:hypothetical protein
MLRRLLLVVVLVVVLPSAVGAVAQWATQPG